MIDPWLILMWGGVAALAIGRAVVRRLSYTARYTLWGDDPAHPTGQNRTDRAIGGCIGWLMTFMLAVAFVAAVGETVGVW